MVGNAKRRRSNAGLFLYRGDLPLENSLDLLKMFFQLAFGTLTVCELENGHINS